MSETIAEVYERLKNHPALARPELLPESHIGGILHDLWRTVEAAQAPCVWTRTPNALDAWLTACGVKTTIIVPMHVIVRYCPYCGRLLATRAGPVAAGTPPAALKST